MAHRGQPGMMAETFVFMRAYVLVCEYFGLKGSKYKV